MVQILQETCLRDCPSTLYALKLLVGVESFHKFTVATSQPQEEFLSVRRGTKTISLATVPSNKHKRGTANVTKAHREKPVESVADTRTPSNEILITSGGNSRNCLVSACTHVTVVLTQQNKRGIRVWRIFCPLLFGPVTIRARLHG